MAATGHIHESGIGPTGLGIEVLPAGDNRRHDRIGAVRRTVRSGRIDHQPGDHDDYANAAAGALWLVAGAANAAGRRTSAPHPVD